MIDRNNELDGFSQEYYAFTEGNKNNFSKAINRLLGETFLVKDKEEDYDDYFFLAEYQTMVSHFLALIDYEFVLDYTNGLAYIKTMENRNRVRLNKLDTAVLFALRLLEIEQKKQVTSDDKVIINLEQVVEQLKVAGLLDYAKRPSFYLPTLRKLKTHKLIDFRGNVLSSSTQIQILPSIHVLIPSNGLEDLVAKIASLNTKTDTNNENNGGNLDEEKSDED